ncbi:MAG TPA: gamma carbonic anhydrase family protein [Pseudomonas sp.]|jgi:carbonic anhydrase/acetyltransferase-like protein (isoleucine patch superfamily)|nr:gamma carbonic anhydrase family protein [Pseudomonas sp.]
MAIYEYDGQRPELHDSVYVAEDATVIGKVALGEGASVWPQAVLRGDNELIEIGAGSNVQEGAVLHTDPGYPLRVGTDVTIGHQVMLHGCQIGDGSLIGIQSVILNGAVIGRNCLVGAGSVVPEGKVFPDNSLILGVPAKVVRELTEDAIHGFHQNAHDYVERARIHKRTLIRIA